MLLLMVGIIPLLGKMVERGMIDTSAIAERTAPQIEATPDAYSGIIDQAKAICTADAIGNLAAMEEQAAIYQGEIDTLNAQIKSASEERINSINLRLAEVSSEREALMLSIDKERARLDQERERMLLEAEQAGIEIAQQRTASLTM